MNRLTRAALAALILAPAVASPSALAQAQFAEGFESVGPTDPVVDGPSNLVARGWIFRNQSNPEGSSDWYGSDGGQSFSAHTGHTVLAADYDSTNASQPGAAISSWAILPAIPNQRAGDTVRFFVQGSAYSREDRLQVRYSPGGGTSTGSGASDTGDFSQVLLDINPVPRSAGWAEYTAPAPGPGRIAFRYYLTNVGPTYNTGGFFGIDSLTVGTPPPGPYPVPQPGQTVTWTRAMSPIVLNGNVVIPAGGTVLVEAGVEVRALANSTLTVRGTVVAQGTAASHVALNAASNYPPLVELIGGTLDLRFTDVTGQIRPMAGGQLMISDSAFTGPNGLIFADLYSGTGFGRIERTTFTSSELTISNYTLVLRDLTLNSTFTRMVRDFVFASNIVSDGGPLDFSASPQGTLIESVTVRNSPSYGLGLGDGNFLIGPGVVLQNNGYPAHLFDGGILPGSVLPATGNTNNVVFVPSGDARGGGDTWADPGIPYFLSGFQSRYGSPLTVLPGVMVLMAPGSGMIASPSPVEVLGTEERPVSILQATPGGRWFPWQNVYRFRHTIMDGAVTAAAWPSQLGWGFMDSSEVRNCSDFGVRGQGVIRKTLFRSNGTGANVAFNRDLLGETNPNAFEGNAVGVSAASDATLNWWGSPTGPRSPQNPGGTGDAAASGVPVFPFRTQRPDFTDAPPVVDLQEHAHLARPGQKMVITWTARDDGTIASQRVLMSLDGDIVQGNLSEPVVVLGENLPGSQRSLEFVVPEPSSRFFGSSNIRVESTDNAGQVGWDDTHLYLEQDEQGQLAFTSNPTGPFTAGERIGGVCWEEQGINPFGGSVNAYLLLENSNYYISLGGVTTYLNCLALDLYAPFVSTDRARVVLTLFTGGGVAQPEFYFSEPFAVRADTRVGDTAPSVTITAPAAGASFAGGTVVPVRWSASDNDFVRTFHLQASYDGGRTWSFIARDLPGATSSYDWRLPPSTGIPAVQVKVIAVDKRFQDSSSIVAITVTPGSGSACVADFTGDGAANVQDFLAYLQAFSAGEARADIDGNSQVNVQDFLAFLQAYAAGC
jgi:hypothetical protein